MISDWYRGGLKVKRAFKIFDHVELWVGAYSFPRTRCASRSLSLSLRPVLSHTIIFIALDVKGFPAYREGDFIQDVLYIYLQGVE